MRGGLVARGLLLVTAGVAAWLLLVAARSPRPGEDRPAQQPHAVNLSTDQGPVGTQLTVSGTGFDGGSRVQVFIDGINHPLGPSTVVDGQGTFEQDVTIPGGATVGQHQICAQVNSQTPTCSVFGVVAPPPTATPVPTPIATPTPAPTPAPTSTPATPIPIGTPSNSAGALSPLFPWILIPAAILLGLLVLAIYLIRRGRGGSTGLPPGPTRRPGRPTVTHRSPRSYRTPPWSEPGAEGTAEDEQQSLPGESEQPPGLPPGEDDRGR
ncbi:MAG: hypothetical protein J2P40_12590 [Candidatus Dormibacteraeota bacterium]|nr:hypothetical protein [Candidatus Dormibacteraeota bacterium]MBO0762104.1 hypothetical protein [Candidatus Dormibacteraeota bacterium]